MLTLRNVGKAYKNFAKELIRLYDWLAFGKKQRYTNNWVLRDISFEVSQGEAIGIMGVNGAGKSTLLRLIAGIAKPTLGSISVVGSVAALLELGNIFDSRFTGRQNAMMAGQLLGISSREMKSLLPEIEVFAELGEYIDQPLRVYSTGMVMRLAFSVATARRPDIFLVDEALAVGDSYFQAKCFARIKQFRREGTTLLLVTHNPEELVKHCERAILLKNGRIFMDGSSRDVSNAYLNELQSKSSTTLISRPQSLNSDSTESDNFFDKTEVNHNLFTSRPGYRKEEVRWGTREAEIVDYLLVSDGVEYPAYIESGAIANFYIKVLFKSDIADVVPGLLIKTLEGVFVYGTNSLISSNENRIFIGRATESEIFCFTIPMRLKEGHYLISFGVGEGKNYRDELAALDRRYDSIMVHIKGGSEFSGIVDLGAGFSRFQ